MEFGIIGDQDTILGYRFAGVATYEADDETTARKVFTEIIETKTCRILLMTKKVAVMIEEDVIEHRLAAVPPYIVEVSDLRETPTKGKTLEQMIFEAVGIRIVREE